MKPNKSIFEHRRHTPIVAPLLIIAFILCCFSSCGNTQNVSYSQFVDIDPDGWFSGQYFVFDTDVPDSTIFLNTSARYDVIITVRHNTAYPYNNLWLAIEESSSADSIATAKADLRLSTPSGSWRGKGAAGVYEFSDTIRRGVKLTPGYTISLRHDMPQSTLPGILNLGVIIAKHAN